MRLTLAVCIGAALVAAGPRTSAQDAPAGAKAPGKRLQIQFLEIRERGEAKTPARPSSVVVHADAKETWLFVGRQVAITVNGREAPTTIFKNAGLDVKIAVATLSDGRYRLDAKFEESSLLASELPPGENPIFRIVRVESRLTLREGETVPFATAVDPVKGDVVRIDVALAAAPTAKPSAAPATEDGRLRARLVLVRRQGEATLARRPYSVLLRAGDEESASVFSGSMLPVRTLMQGQPTVALKDVGASLRLHAARRIPDGRYQLDLSVSDGVLAAAPPVVPIVNAFQSESQLFLHLGESVTIASVVDPLSGESVEAELTLEAVR